MEKKSEDTFKNIRLMELKKDIPLIPEKFIGKEPSLYDLGQFEEEYSDLLKDHDELKVGLKGYISDSKESWAKGTYYLLGQLQLLPSDRLSNEILNKSIEREEQRFIEYGDPCHQAEVWSVQKHADWLKSIKNLIAVYYHVKT